MVRRAWFVGLTLLAVPACSRPRTADEAAAQIVGTWKVVRENDKPVEQPSGKSGLVRFDADGTVTSESSGYSGGKLKVTPITAAYRFLDPETMEVTESGGGREKKTTFRTVIAGNRLTLHKPDEPNRTVEFERQK